MRATAQAGRLEFATAVKSQPSTPWGWRINVSVQNANDVAVIFRGRELSGALGRLNGLCLWRDSAASARGILIRRALPRPNQANPPAETNTGKGTS